MFGLFQRPRRAPTPAPVRRARLSLERLEDRDCPAAPSISSFSATHIGSQLVVSGRVMDENPGSVQVSLGGAVNAQVQANSQGDFHHIISWAGGMEVTAQAVDNEQLSSAPSSAYITHPANANPFVTFSVSYGEEKQITLSGRVIDEAPAGLVVSFYGAATGNTVTDADGHFSLTLTASTLGQVWAMVLDSTWQCSNMVAVSLTSSLPDIENFICQELPGGWYRFTGKVIDESPAGLTVRFGGTPVSLEGKTATVRPDGTFVFDIQLNGTASDEGTASAMVMDWWGLASDLALCDVHQTGVS